MNEASRLQRMRELESTSPGTAFAAFTFSKLLCRSSN